MDPSGVTMHLGFSSGSLRWSLVAISSTLGRRFLLWPLCSMTPPPSFGSRTRLKPVMSRASRSQPVGVPCFAHASCLAMERVFESIRPLDLLGEDEDSWPVLGAFSYWRKDIESVRPLSTSSAWVRALDNKRGTFQTTGSTNIVRSLLKTFCISMTGRSFASSPKGFSSSMAIRSRPIMQQTETPVNKTHDQMLFVQVLTTTGVISV
mmetsp:Transcript_24632/g.56018  ORF Transcript_24632/g.56018 Transcript_24632/m.56018 type:complete len:207 (-) Transcript_24632:441-1061(-)